MGKALGLLLIVVASGLLVYLFIAPLLTPTPSKPGSAAVPVPVSAAETPAQPTTAPAPAADSHTVPTPSGDVALPPPRSPEQRAADDLETKRAPYYRWMREQAPDRVADVRPADDDAATLVIYTTYDNPDVAPSLTRDVVAPAAFRYGFRHVRYFAPNTPGSVSQYRFDAEATVDANGDWNTFHK
jgi:hypothetical protein